MSKRNWKESRAVEGHAKTDIERYRNKEIYKEIG